MMHKALPLALSMSLMLVACGGGADTSTTKLLASPLQATPTAPVPHTLARCYANPLFQTPGASYEIDGTATTPDRTISFFDIFNVKGKTTFNGAEVMETELTEANSIVSNDIYIANRYENMTATSRFQHGLKHHFSWRPEETVFTYSPPIETPLTLRENQTFVQTYLMNINYPPMGTTIATMRATTTFLGIETVKVPAGTFRACKIERNEEQIDLDYTPAQNVRTEWIIASGKYAGFVIKAMVPSSGWSYEATRVKIN